eukprot:335823-Pyramimonas_sp.AAC.1
MSAQRERYASVVFRRLPRIENTQTLSLPTSHEQQLYRFDNIVGGRPAWAALHPIKQSIENRYVWIKRSVSGRPVLMSQTHDIGYPRYDCHVDQSN